LSRCFERYYRERSCECYKTSTRCERGGEYFISNRGVHSKPII